MALKGLVTKLSIKLAESLTLKSARETWLPSGGSFPRLLHMDHDAIQAMPEGGGLLAFWHGGVRPQWVFVGHTTDLRNTVLQAQPHPDLILYDRNAGLWVSWAACDAEDRPAAVIYLNNELEPALGPQAIAGAGAILEDMEPKPFPLPAD